MKVDKVRGTTLVELLVGMLMFLSGLVAIMSTSVNLKFVARRERSGIDQNQGLSSTMQLLGVDIRLAAQGIRDGIFPAVLINNNGKLDELILRREVDPTAMFVCEEATSGSSVIKVAVTGGVIGTASGGTPVIEGGCDVSSPGNLTLFNSMQSYRNSRGGSVRAFIYNSVTRTGEFFSYVNEVTSGGTRELRSGASLSNTYPPRSRVMLITENRYRVNAQNQLELVVDEENANAEVVLSNIEEFNLRVRDIADNNFNEWITSNPWREIRVIRVNLATRKSVLNQTVIKRTNSQFSIRNIY
jgi:hypothetical protein